MRKVLKLNGKRREEGITKRLIKKKAEKFTFWEKNTEKDNVSKTI